MWLTTHWLCHPPQVCPSTSSTRTPTSWCRMHARHHTHVISLHRKHMLLRLPAKQRGLLMMKSSCNEIATLLGMETLDTAQDMLRYVACDKFDDKSITLYTLTYTTPNPGAALSLQT